ncbi:hypothetical protein [Streptomyces sp. NPDC046925]|uniref:hypothetical protein n=1 Tax=Streptomyces sp. NPDC046925 TaxID=3155375 RepID=UPI0033FA3EC6
MEAHLHFAVVEIGGPGLVLAVLERFAQRSVYPAALFWSNVNSYAAFRLDRDERFALGLPAGVPRPRTSADTADRPIPEAR